MPLFNGDTPEVIQMNIRKLISEGYSNEQAIAIAYAEAEKYRKARKKKWGYRSMLTAYSIRQRA